MLNVIVSKDGKADCHVQVDGAPFRIGRDKSSDIVVSKLWGASEHAEIRLDDGEYWLFAHLETGINGKGVRGRHGPLRDGDEITVSGYRLRVQPGRGQVAEGIDRSDRVGQMPATDVAPPNDQPEGPDHSQETLAFRKKLHARLVEEMNLRHRDARALDDDALRREAEPLLLELAKANDFDGIAREQLVQDVLDEVVGYGPLTRLMEDTSVSEIMVNAPNEIWVERKGRLERTRDAFTSEQALRGVLERMVSRTGRRIDESSPMVDARLADGSRLNAVIPPLAQKGTAITIRKFSKKLLTAESLIALGAASPEMMDFIRVAVTHKQNIGICGGTGTGKTTNLNVFSGFIPIAERVITIEDAAELQLPHPHLVSLEARPANSEGRGAISIRDLVKNALRMRPDRIVVGECRDEAALDMLQAMSTGHEGSLTTWHGASPRDSLGRLEVLAMMSGTAIPAAALREQTASAIDLIIQIQRFADGSRRIDEIAELTGIEAGRIQLQTLFQFERTGVDQDGRVLGYFTGCNTIPVFYEELTRAGVVLDLSIFKRRAE